MTSHIVTAGMKADVDRAKQAALLGEEYNPAIPGVGAAWSHNFLNQVLALSASFTCNISGMRPFPVHPKCDGMLTVCVTETMAPPQFQKSDEGI